MVKEAWKLLTKISAAKTAGDNQALKNAATTLEVEFLRLGKQICAYCDGYGHSGNDCPTDRKIAILRGGVLEQNKVIQAARKTCRVEAGMAAVTGFSLLSSNPNTILLGKRGAVANDETMSADNGFTTKRRKFK